MLVSNEWIRKHEHDLDGWEPKIELTRPNGSKDTIVIRSKEAVPTKSIKGSKGETMNDWLTGKDEPYEPEFESELDYILAQ